MKCKIYSLTLAIIKCGTVFASCKVSNVPVQPNFDIEKFAGVTWYEQFWLPSPDHPKDTLSQDYQQTFYLHPDGRTITAFSNGRNPPDLECFYYTSEFKTTDVHGKWLQIQGGQPTDYWIVSTDYTDYSVTYSCQKQDEVGNCTVPLVWVWSRKSEGLPVHKRAIVDDLLDSLCVNKTAFFQTDQINECSEQKDCRIYAIDSQRQQNFDIRRYAGKWFEIAWLPQSFIPKEWLYQDYQHFYDLSSDGTFLTGFVRGRDPVDLSKCFYNQVQLMSTPQPGKFIYRRNINSTYIMAADYWVMKTDYDNYAVIYGCRKLDETGTCLLADSWIWSRFPTLSTSVASEVETVKNSLCVNTTMYLATKQTNECSLNRDCTVPSIKLRAVENLNMTQLQGTWYKYSVLSVTDSEAFTDYVMVIGSIEASSQSAKTKVSYINQNGQCQSANIVISQPETGGKLLTSRRESTGIAQRESYVMGTDYSSYYVEYSCLRQDGNSKCSNPAASLWTRSLSLTPEANVEASRVIFGLCIELDKFIKMKHSQDCPVSKGVATIQPVLLNILPFLLIFK